MNKGQDIFIEKLNDIKDISNIKINKDKLFDISCDYKNSTYTFEVKYDLMATKTGNIAIEYFNPKLNKESGILATQADFWVTILHNPTEIFISPVKILKKFLDNIPPCRIITIGGDNNSSMMLYKKEKILGDCMIKINSFVDLINVIEDLNA